MNQRNQYVVLGDAIESREVSQRDEFGKTLAETLEYVNDAHRRYIDTAFETIKGIDEFGGVLRSLSPICEVVLDVSNGIYPVRVRFGIAKGSVDVNETAESVSEMDGPAFHRADRLLVGAESDEMYAYIDGEEPTDGLVSNNIYLLLMQRTVDRAPGGNDPGLRAPRNPGSRGRRIFGSTAIRLSNLRPGGIQTSKTTAPKLTRRAGGCVRKANGHRSVIRLGGWTSR